MRQKKNPAIRNRLVIGALAGGLLVLSLSKTLNKKQVREPSLEMKVEQVDEVRDNIDFMTRYLESNQRTKLNPGDYKTNDFSQDSNKVLLARMLFGEARGCSKNEKIAIAYSAINRINDGKKRNGENLREVLLRPWQYSCFNKNDINFEKIKNPLYHDEKYFNYNGKAFEECLEVSKEVLSGKYKEFNQGQTHYFNPRYANPYWADKMKKIGKIGDSKHDFYIEN